MNKIHKIFHALTTPASVPASFGRLLNFADDLVTTSAKPQYSWPLAVRGVDAQFLTVLRVKVLQATLNPAPEYALLTEIAEMCFQIQTTANSLPFDGRHRPSEIVADFKIALN